MGYERNDRGYGRDTNRPDAYRSDADRADAYRGDTCRNDGRHDRGNPQDRGFFERAGDEVRSWFGDEEAERRRRYDERFDERYDREHGNDRGRHDGYGAGDHSSASYPRYDRSNSPNADRGGYARDPYASRQPESGARFAGTVGGGQRTDGGRDWRDAEYRALYENRGRDRQDDPHGYHGWREQQISSFDRDYDEYRRENQSRFASEFSAWRENRQTQRTSLRQAKEHQEVVGLDGAHVGTVDHVRGDRILLTKTDKDAGGHHHSIPSSWIQSVDDKVHIAKTAEQAHQAWRDEENNSGLFGDHVRGNDRDADRGPADLDRSFSGTY